MTITFAERADQLCDRLREMEHHAEEGDPLFYCAYPRIQVRSATLFISSN
jgi:hypothetical protein